MLIKIFTGTINNPEYLTEINSLMFPKIKDCICIEVDPSSFTNVFVVKQILIDYTKNIYNVFVDYYDWE